MTWTNADHYAVLGLPLGASKEEVRSAYRRLVKLYHPDKNTSPEAETRYRQIQAAYETLREDAVWPVWQTPPSWERAAPPAPSAASSQASSSSSQASAASSQASSWSSARNPNVRGQGRRFGISDVEKEILFNSLHGNRGCGSTSVLWLSMAVILLFLALLLFGVGSIFPR